MSNINFLVNLIAMQKRYEEQKLAAGAAGDEKAAEEAAVGEQFASDALRGALGLPAKGLNSSKEAK